MIKKQYIYDTIIRKITSEKFNYICCFIKRMSSNFTFLSLEDIGFYLSNILERTDIEELEMMSDSEILNFAKDIKLCINELNEMYN